ncbi:hypothetical protein B0H14DRAFT_3568683 [Mycena olivaceomarginata]|nr:hypothetical protein B0H14DRAFT_3568683 [Mycena olivaceomarginata]
MSSFYILGFFQLKAGRRVIVTKPNSNFPTHYAQYSTNVWCLDNTTIPADICVSTASTTPLVPDGMVAFAARTAQPTATPPTAKSLVSNALPLNALMFVVLLGNPESDTYNTCSVSLPYPWLAGHELRHPRRNIAASESSISTSLAQEDSAFNRSATNPYNYPMTQMTTAAPSTRTNFLFLFLVDDAIHSSNTFNHTGTHGGNHGGNFHTFGLIGVRDCGPNWPRPEPSFDEELIASQLALC